MVFIEGKVESSLQPQQLERYRSELKASGKDETALALLTRHPLSLYEGRESPDVHIRWFEVADWLKNLKLSEPVAAYSANQFVEFLNSRGLTMEKVSWELTNGAPAVYHLLTMLQEVISKAEYQVRINFESKDGYIGMFFADSKYWVGFNLNEPNKVYWNTYKCAIDEALAKSLGYNENLFPSEFPRHTLGPWRLNRTVDLGSEGESHFFALGQKLANSRIPKSFDVMNAFIRMAERAVKATT